MTTPKVEVLPITKGATPDPNNVNKHTAKGGKLLDNSLRKRGAFRSIASAGKGVDTPVVYAGNYTLEKAVDAGFTEIINVHVTGNQLVNVVRDDLAPNSPEAIALGIEDNEIAKQSYNPDIDILAAIMADPMMQAIQAEDRILSEIVGSMGVKGESVDAPAEIDRAAELQTKWNTATGQLWKLGEHRLLIGDCTVRENVERLMGVERAGMCFTSPPYNAGISARLRGNTSIDDNFYGDEYDDNQTEDNYLRLLNDFTNNALSCCDYVFVNIQVLAGNKKAFIRYWANLCDVFCDVAIWDKGRAAPQQAQRVMDSRFEFVLVFGGNGSRAIGTRDFRGMVHNVYEGSPQRYNENADIHAATMPIDFPEYFIKTFTNNGELIYEPFCGTGTTIIAAHNLNRRCYAMEISEKYGAVILERFLTATNIEPELVK